MKKQFIKTLSLFIFVFALIALPAFIASADEVQDYQISKDVAFGIGSNTGLDGTAIRVATVKGVVTLNGIVDTSDQKNLANIIASEVKGVKSVNNQLKVQPGYSATDKASVNFDRAINLRAKRVLAEYNYTDVQPSTTNRVVTLNGVVPTSKDRDNAASLVNKIDGVKGVDNQIMAQTELSEAQKTDAEITRRVHAAIDADPYIDPMNTITVSTVNGMVTLNGAVGIPDNVKQAAQDAAQIPGVKAVNNQLSFADN